MTHYALFLTKSEFGNLQRREKRASQHLPSLLARTTILCCGTFKAVDTAPCNNRRKKSLISWRTRGKGSDNETGNLRQRLAGLWVILLSSYTYLNNGWCLGRPVLCYTYLNTGWCLGRPALCYTYLKNDRCLGRSVLCYTYLKNGWFLGRPFLCCTYMNTGWFLGRPVLYYTCPYNGWFLGYPPLQ